MPTIKMPVKCYTDMKSPYDFPGAPQKVRFFCRLDNVPDELLHWMAPNPREQNLNSPVAQTIAASMREDHHEFHLRNRGILLSAKSVSFNEETGEVSIEMDDPTLHGNIDGGHTMRLILAAKEPLPEQYVEFEVVVGLTSAIDIAEARNTSVALDVRSMEEMKGSYEVLKKVPGDATIGGDRFFERVEFRMNQQLEEKNAIDIRTIISILLMFNQDLFPCDTTDNLNKYLPNQMYGGREYALKKFLALGDGDTEKRNAILEKMSPIFLDILTLWDTIEKDFPNIKVKRFKYEKMPFATRKKEPKALFSNASMQYVVPQSILYPLVAAFRVVVKVDEDGNYGWITDPFELWQENQSELISTVIADLAQFKSKPDLTVTHKLVWTNPSLSLKLAIFRKTGTLEN